jgi:hypothetical protein
VRVRAGERPSAAVSGADGPCPVVGDVVDVADVGGAAGIAGVGAVAGAADAVDAVGSADVRRGWGMGRA